jgi:membrane protease YdiL (CAAX protease family)
MSTTIDQETAPSLGARILRHWAVRLLLFFFSLLVLYALSQIAALELVGKHGPVSSRPWMMILASLATSAALIFAYQLLVRWLEKRPTTELTLAGAAPQLFAGTIIGVVLFSLVIGTLVVSGHGRVTLPAAIIFPFAGFAISILSGVGEELLFRGALFRIVEERWGTLVALLTSAAFFGAIHGGNPGATAISSIAIALEAGLLLALAYTATRTLWLPIGLHFAWNFTEGGIFSTQVSGGTVHGLFATKLTGDKLLTGGAFGPEASIVAVAICLIAALFFLVITLRRAQWRPFTLRAAKRL